MDDSVDAFQVTRRDVPDVFFQGRGRNRYPII